MPFVDHEPPEAIPCRDPQHDPPKMIVLRPGTHTWECPRCKHQQLVSVREPLCRM